MSEVADKVVKVLQEKIRNNNLLEIRLSEISRFSNIDVDTISKHINEIRSKLWNLNLKLDIRNCQAIFWIITRKKEKAKKACQPNENNSLTEYRVESNIKKIKEYKFCNCKKLKTLYIDSEDLTVNRDAFFQTNIEEIYFKNINCFLGLKCLGKTPSLISEKTKIFINNELLEDLVIDKPIKTIHEYFISNYNYLRSIKFIEKVDVIGSKAFYNCRNLKSIIFNKKVGNICCSSFEKCSSLENVIFSSIGNISTNAFLDCNRLTTILGQNIGNIEENAFAKCHSLNNICKNIQSYDLNSFSESGLYLVMVDKYIDSHMIEKNKESIEKLFEKYKDKKDIIIFYFIKMGIIKEPIIKLETKNKDFYVYKFNVKIGKSTISGFSKVKCIETKYANQIIYREISKKIYQDFYSKIQVHKESVFSGNSINPVYAKYKEHKDKFKN